MEPVNETGIDMAGRRDARVVSLQLTMCVVRFRPQFEPGSGRAPGTEQPFIKEETMFASPAFAQAAAAGGTASSLISFAPIILIFAIMYLLMIRPQQKKVKEHKAMIEALRRGDQVVTSGGLIGKVVKVGDAEVELELAPNVKVRLVRSTITQVMSKTVPVEADAKA